MSKFKYAASSLTLVFLLSALTQTISAGTLQNISDTIDISEPGKQAVHTISFTAQTEVPSSGKIVIKFPPLSEGDSNNEASPSASTFQLNKLGEVPELVKVLRDGSDISSSVSPGTTNPTTNNSPTVTITLNSSTSIEAGSKILIFIGCSKVTSGKCVEHSPRIINPTKTKAQGLADSWSITVTTQNASSQDLDSASARIATIEPVRVAAQIDPVLIFTISGIENSKDVNIGNTTGCKNSTDTNTGASSTATKVGLGNLSTARINVSAQLLTITTNLSSGYSLVASSSGGLSSGGNEILSGPSPQEIIKGQTRFGIRPCGADVSETWGTNSNRLYAWPKSDTPIALVSDSTGPVGDDVAKGNGLISLEYAATIADDIPAGVYKTSVTYIVTATF